MSNPERQCPPEFLNSQQLFGARVRKFRDSLGLSREVVAERAGIDADYLGEIERGEKWPALWMTRAIARVVAVSAARFFEFEEDTDDAPPTDKIKRLLDGRTPEEQNKALRVIRVMFGS
jgi:transcriptional regulator with XRE-family HTH domain